MSAFPLPASDFELLFAALPSPLVALGADGMVQTLNTAMTTLLGPAAARLPGQPLAAFREALAAAGHAVAPAAAWVAGLAGAQAGTLQTLAPAWTPGPPLPRHWEATLQPVPAARGVPYVLVRLLDVTEQLRATAEHTRHRAESEFMTENMPQLLWTAAADGAVKYANRSWYAYTGLTPAETYGQGFLTAVHPDDRAETVNRWQQCIETGENPEIFYRLRHGATGHYRWHLLRGFAQRAAAGAITQWFGSITDMDEQHRSRELLLAQQQRMEYILDQLPLTISTVEGPELAFTFLSKKARQAMGARAVLGRPVAESLPEVAAQGYLQLLQEVRDSGQPRFGHEERTELLDPATGETQVRFTDFGYLPLRDENGPGVLAYGLDVTEQVLARQRSELLAAENQRQQQQFGHILAQSPALLATLEGPEHRFTLTNPGYDALVGGRARLGQRVADCLPELVEQGFVGRLDVVYRTGESFVGTELLVEFRDPATGEPRPSYLNVTYQALRDAQGGITGILAFIVDVSAQVAARQEADALQVAVQAADNRLRHLAAALPIVTFTTDEQGRTTYISSQWYAYTGQAPGGPWAEVDALWPEVLYPDDRAEAARQIRQSIDLAQLGRVEVRLRRHDGAYRWFMTEAVPELDADGHLLRRYGYLLDVHDQRERTEELRRSREDFAALADNISQLAWMADATGHIFWYNQQWYDYTGFAPEDMRGQGWRQAHDPAQADRTNERYLASIQAGQPWEDTFPLRRHDGTYRWFLSRARPIRDAATGQVLRWFGTNTDVTELRELQQRLAESEEELRIQAESLPQQIWTAQPDGTVDFYNHRTAAYLGESVEKNGAAGWLEFVHPDDRAPMQERWESAIASQRYYEAEFRLRRYDGQYRWFLGQAQARRAPGGQVLKWYGTHTDVHQQRQLQEQVLASQARFQQMLETLPQLAWTARPDGNLNYYNQRWYDLTGATFNQLRDQGWQHFIHPDDYTETLRRWQHSLATGQAFETELRWRDRHGHYRWFLARGEAVRDKNGEVVLWVGANTDIDEFKQVQRQLEAQNARLVRTNEDLDSFIYTASHDLKQPISNMAGIFEELTRTAYFRDPDAVKLIAYFERALNQIFATIDDLSTIVQGQRQQQEMPAEDVALAPLVAEIIGSLQDQVTQSGATFELDFATCPTVHFVRPNLQSALFNLLSNSLKYAAPGRPPRIRLSATPDAVTGRSVLTVQDNGMGIDLERFGHQLFQLFRRFHTHVGGTGMGLYLINRIVQNHGGRLEVHSVVNEGTTFQIYL